MSEAPAGDDAASVATEAATGSPEEPSLLLLDPSEDEREWIEQLEDELGLRVSALAPAEADLSRLESLPDASIIVVAWDLGGRAGIEVVEALLRQAPGRAARVVMSAKAPTRGMVSAALRAGAAGFLQTPYEAEALQGLLRGT